MKLGSDAHKALFCRQFIDSHLLYEPEKLPWPTLEGVALERLRAIPFWKEALLTEQEASAMVSAYAETIEDPLLREAIALQGREESRHARLIQFLIQHYQIPLAKPPVVQLPQNIKNAFLDFGFGECLDSFFAFGMFDIARQANYLPEALFTIFDPILDEEARHIVFFVNYFTYLQIQQGRKWSSFRALPTLWHYGKAIQTLIATFSGNNETDDSKPFTASEAVHFMDNLTPERFFSTCLQANSRRMQVFDPQLLQPNLMPSLSTIALNILKLLPKRQTSAAGIAQQS